MKPAIKKAVVPAAVTTFIAATILGTPELITQAILTTAGFVTAMIVAVAFWRLTSVSAWPQWKQRVGVWLVASGSAAVGCFVLLAPAFFRR